MKNKILYDLEYQVEQLRKQYINKVKYDEITIKELLELGFNNNYLRINDETYDLGYCNIRGEIDFYEDIKLTDDILNIKIVYDDYDLSDNSYCYIVVKCKNKEDEKKILNQIESEE